MNRTAPLRTAPRALPRMLQVCVLLAGATLTSACASDEPTAPDLRRPTAASMPRPNVGGAHGHLIRGLVSTNFEERTRAARALVAAGDDAVPALGRAGSVQVPVAGGMQVSATQSVLRSILEQSENASLDRHLGSPWPTVRRVAADEAGRRDRWPAIPRLIERLDDPDPDVRAAAASSLRRMTNQFLGYRAQASLGARRSSADRWRTWWSQEGRARMEKRESERRSVGALPSVPRVISAHRTREE